MTRTTVYNKMLQDDVELLTTYRWSGHTCGVYGEECLYKFGRLLKRRIKDKRQNIVVVVGDTGSGKSTFAIQLAKAINPKWDLAENYIYGVEDLRRKLDREDPDPVSLFDEGSVALNAKNAMKGEDKLLVVLFDTMRSRGWTTIICIPKLEALNKSIRENHANFLCVCPSLPIIPGYETRGFVQIFENQKFEWRKNFWKLGATTIYGKLPKREEVKYDAIKRQHQDELLAKFMKGDKGEVEE